ncbi:MAG: (d)CMP kinase [Oscillospiraceae bacterium]|nr:(d)CMP kinase [Oscillospiraceae bacterium]
MRAIAIDGPAGAGKSTMAKAVAKALGYVYVDTGAIYRTLGCHYEMLGIGPKDRDGITRLIGDAFIEARYTEEGEQRMFLNGEDVTGLLRTPEISDYASKISAFPVVREYLLDMQRQIAREQNVVMDGRDIGTVVLPDADVKIFLTASPEERARRRYEELKAKDPKTKYEKVLQDLLQRDEQDSTRKIAPLRKAHDAYELDTTNLGIDDSVQAILEIVREKLG